MYFLLKTSYHFPVNCKKKKFMWVLQKRKRKAFSNSDGFCFTPFYSDTQWVIFCCGGSQVKKKTEIKFSTFYDKYISQKNFCFDFVPIRGAGIEKRNSNFKVQRQNLLVGVFFFWIQKFFLVFRKQQIIEKEKNLCFFLS